MNKCSYKVYSEQLATDPASLDRAGGDGKIDPYRHHRQSPTVIDHAIQNFAITDVK